MINLRLNIKVLNVNGTARTVPYNLVAKVKNELDKWEKTGVIEPLGQDENIPDWCTPLVIVGKPDGNVRICVDFRVTLKP